MATETIVIDGRRVKTLRELLQPGLTAVFVGSNPACMSVEKGHYYQGKSGKRLWTRLQQHGITGPLPAGAEDDAAFAAGFGFADLVRRPTKSARELKRHELKSAAINLARRLQVTGHPRPIVVFVYASAAKYAQAVLEELGYETYRLPSPFAKREEAAATMVELARLLRRKRRRRKKAPR